MNEQRKPFDENDGRDRQVAVAGEQRYLPSTEVRDSVPDWAGDEVNLRDYLDVLIRRKWLVVSFLTLVFVTTLVFTLSRPKIYKADGTIEVASESPKVTKFEEVVAAEIKGREFYVTQVQLLESPALAERVIKQLNIAGDPAIQEALFGKDEPGLLDGVKSGLMGLINGLFRGDDPEAAAVLAVPEDVLKQNALLGFMKENFSVKPDRQSLIIHVSFTCRERRSAQRILNAYIENFIHAQMEKKLDASELARSFLMKQIDRAKITLEKAEEDLNRFAQQAGIVSLDVKMNSIYRQLEEINTALAEAETKLIGAEAVHRQAVTDGPESLTQVLNNPTIGVLKEEYAKLNGEYKRLSVTFHDEYPAVQAIKSRMESVAGNIRAEQNKIFKAVRSDYETALKQFDTLRNRAESQKRLAMDLNERATQYKIMQREVETNKSIYQSLLQRAKEIESMVGVSASNIQVVDQARLPIFPFKPNVKLNLLLAMVVGLMGGIGLAFVLEYFTDTIVNPDEITDRFHVPILGVLPLTKTADDLPLEKIFVHDPRSPLSEALRTTRVSIQLSGADLNARSFLVSSTQPSEGKTTVAVNLAYTFAGAGERVILLDTDLRKPRIHRVFKDQKNGVPGLSKYLAGVVDNPGVCQAEDEKNLYFIPVGPIPPNPVELLASHRFKRMLELLQEKFDRIILDGPPHHGFADVLVLSRHVGGIVLVSAVGETTRSNLRQLKKAILNVRGNILGCIINKINLTKRYGYRSYYRYYQAYSYYDYDAGGAKKRKKFWTRKKKTERIEMDGELVQGFQEHAESMKGAPASVSLN